MFTLQHLDHIAITVSDLQRSKEWYCDVLGMKVPPVKIINWSLAKITAASGNVGRFSKSPYTFGFP